MDFESVAKAVTAVVTPVVALAGVASRRKRLRNEIRENLALAEELQKNTILNEHTPVAVWLYGRIALDVAKLTGQPLGVPKKPIPKGSVVAAAVISAGFGWWVYLIDRGGFVWYSVFPGSVSVLMLISILGMTTNREIPDASQGSGQQDPEGEEAGAAEEISGLPAEEAACAMRERTGWQESPGAGSRNRLRGADLQVQRHAASGVTPRHDPSGACKAGVVGSNPTGGS
ncbi:hypothetical protein [Kitasatospora sp. GP82]|uniref:hypothetical protein n=1 Tax=Kitasatospora sp. GP82 TaxID=3035089 RepID=UPI0024734005|nr:hypothetical protein [Kitasatospora sp. GP82]